MGILNNKVAFVTDAGSGIGKEIAILYAQEGAKVVVSDNNEAPVVAFYCFYSITKKS